MKEYDPILDAQHYLNEMDSKPIEYDHKCESCQRGFFKGSQFMDEKFCGECVEGNKHIEFYKDLDLTDHFIYENILSTEIILNQ